MLEAVTRVKQALAAISVEVISRSDNLQRHMRTCASSFFFFTNVPAPATTVRSRPTGKLLFTLQQIRRALAGAVEQFTVNMKEATRLSTLKKAMVKFQQDHRAYKFQVTVSFFTRQLIALL